MKTGHPGSVRAAWVINTAVFMCVLLVACVPSLGAEEPLSEYEGLYEYQNDSTLIIVAGPEREMLYAVINGARYPLRPSHEDVFLNGADQRVVFIRDEIGLVVGFREVEAEGVDVRTFKMLERDRRLKGSFWKARPQDAPSPYRYREPTDIGDCVSVGGLDPADPLLERLEAMTDAIYAERFPYTQSVLVFYDDRLVFEEYFYEYDRGTPHQLRSATKTLVAMLAGIAIDRGLISSIDVPVLPYFTEYKDLNFVDDAKRSVTIGDLLSMQSGFACNDYDADSPGRETLMVGSDDWARFMLDLPVIDEPGTVGFYCSGNVALVGRIIEKASGMPLVEFAEETLFGPLGIDEYSWDFRPDRSNIDNFTQAWMRPRDMLKIGMLLKDGGRWQGVQVVSGEWVDALTSTQASIGGTPYGYFYWLRYVNVPGVGRVEIPQLSGNGGQKVIHIAEHDMVVVMTGGNYNNGSNTNQLLAEFILSESP